MTMRKLAPQVIGLILAMLFMAGCSLQAATPSPAPQPPATQAPTQPPTQVPTDTPLPPTETPLPSPTLTETPYPVFWDDFNAEFQPGWSWIRENDALWSLDSEPGYLRIVLQCARPARNLLVRDVDSDNFQITTHVLFEPTSNFQFAGLLVYQDDKNMASFGRAFCNVKGTCVGNGIYFDLTQDGQMQGSNFATDTKLKDEAYLRLDKTGSHFSGYYSEDGSNWMLIGEHDAEMLDPKVGLITANSCVVGQVALFDYFSSMGLP